MPTSIWEKPSDKLMSPNTFRRELERMLQMVKAIKAALEQDIDAAT